MSLLHIAGGATEDKLDASDVFSTYLYTGNGSTQTINNGIDLASKGGMVWIKARSSSVDHVLTDTTRGVGWALRTNLTASSQTYGSAGLTTFNSSGFVVGSDQAFNDNTRGLVAWTFRESTKFFTIKTKVHTTGTPSTIDLSTLGVVGMVTVKSKIGISNWFTWHKDLTAGNNLKLNLTDAQSTTNAYLSVSGTTLTISGSAPSDTYVIYAWAHDTSADGIIQCGSFTTDGSGKATVNLGWEPQYLLSKTTSTSDWEVVDTMRGFTSNNVVVALKPNSSAVDFDISTQGRSKSVKATGFSITDSANVTSIYLAIRRPNKPPTSGTQVYNAIARTGTGAVATVSGVGFAPDLVIPQRRDGARGAMVSDKLRGANRRLLITIASESSTSDVVSLDMDGITYGSSSDGFSNLSSWTYINYFFKRAKGFMDNFCWTGTGANQTITHNLGVAPELLILKSISASGDWQVWFSGLASNEKLVLNSTAAKAIDATLLNSTLPTSTLISLGTQAAVNTNLYSYVGYAFASLAGVSKVGSYTGNGTSLNIDCGFTTGSRFILIKRTDSTGDWYIWDTARGIVSANDPHLSLNTTAAEVTTDDSVDPAVEGFICNQNTATNINVNGGSYIYLAIA